MAASVGGLALLGATCGGTHVGGGSADDGGARGGTGGSTGTGGLGGSASAGCPVNPSQCTDGIDNDGDGKTDSADPECVGACDNDEGTFATGIPGDNIDACKQDCFFDGNSGMGDDGCDWDLKCDPANPGASAAKSCPYDANYKNCPKMQSDRCIKSCQHLTPNGCDCFGCCAVTVGNQTLNVLLVPSCTASSFGDPAACPRCTQQTSCVNNCGHCEICIGKPALEPDCQIPPVGGASGSDAGAGGAGGAPGDSPCPPGITYCGPGGGTCSSGTYCLTGCCVIP